MKQKIKKQHVNFRFNVLTIVSYTIGVILIVRLFNLQIVHGAEYRETSNTRLSRESKLEATRGDILDRSRKCFGYQQINFQYIIIQNKI